MANVCFKESEQQMVEQGDYVYCEAIKEGYRSFWGIYSSALAVVVSLDGAGTSYVSGRGLLLDSVYNGWKIEKIIPCNKAILKISHRDC